MTDDLKRLSRLAAILTQLQSKTIVTAPSLAKKFDVNVRTIYRDIKALEEAGVPITTEEGKGYSIVDGYHIPPVMFSEREAFSLVTAEQIIKRHKDSSFKKEFSSAIDKIRSVLRTYSKEKAELLEKRIYVGKNTHDQITSSGLIDIQMAVTSRNVIDMGYAAEDSSTTNRTVEPYMLYFTPDDNWVLVAYCRLRKDFRSFRLDRIRDHNVRTTTFGPDEKAFNKYIEEKFVD